MPRTCCVPGCKSNYKSRIKVEGSVTIFRFPKDQQLRDQWVEVIGRKNWTPNIESVVCAKHFDPNEIIREDNYLLPNGTTAKIPTQIRLVRTAVPQFFPHAYIPKTVPPGEEEPSERYQEHQTNDELKTVSFVKEEPEERYEEHQTSDELKTVSLVAREPKKRCEEHQTSDELRVVPLVTKEPETKYEEHQTSDELRKLPHVTRKPERGHEEHQTSDENILRADRILSFQKLIFDYSKKMKFSAFWNVRVVGYSKIYFYTLDLTDTCIKIVNQVLVDNDMNVRVFLKDNELSHNDLKWILPIEMKLSKWSQLENILSRYKFSERESKPRNSVYDNLQKSIYFLKEGISLLNISNIEEDVDSENNEENICNRLLLLVDQLNLLITKQKHHSSSTVIMSFILYTISPHAYELLRDYFNLPTKRYLEYLSSSYDVSPNINLKTADNDGTNYLNTISSSLTSTGKVVNLLIDVIYINKKVKYRYKNHHRFGKGSEDNSSTTTVLAFMICSAFGDFSQVIKLLPMDGIEIEEMDLITKKVISLIQKNGFQVLDIITDNHKINSFSFNLTKNKHFLPNPEYPHHKIFSSFDFVHIFKNVINNWRNLENQDKTFIFPDFFDFSVVKYAKFSDIKYVYEKEKNMSIKKAFKLSYKTVFPNILEVQKVSFADNICHNSTISALKDYGFKDTAEFLEIIRHWWDIVNITSLSKINIEVNELCTGTDDETVQFLRKMISWLDAWLKIGQNSCIPADTYFIMRHSISVLNDIIYYSFTRFFIPHILSGKFTTDQLEKCFGKYRVMAGRNNNISLDKGMNAEKNIRTKHVLKDFTPDIENLVGTSYSDFGTIVPQNSNCEKFLSLLETEYLDEYEIHESAEIYISGYLAEYAAHKISEKIKCSICLSLVGQKFDNEDSNFFKGASLTVPTDIIRDVLFHMCAILEKIINDSTDKDFLHLNDQKGVLISLTLRSMEQHEFYRDLFLVCVCNREYKTLIIMACSIFSNILLNDFMKKMNTT